MKDTGHLLTLVLLHGGTPWEYAENVWYIRDKNKPPTAMNIHALELHRSKNKPDGCFYWSSLEELLSDYCKFYGIPTEVIENERSNQTPTT